MDHEASNKKLDKWKSSLIPIYGERETANMWRWYLESNRDNQDFESDVRKLAEHYPIQYLTGYSYFYGEKFLVNEHTLIPRPETEELVYQVLEDHPGKRPLHVIDLGTGTGCIPIILKKQRPHWVVSGLDLYDHTLEIARKNALLLQADVEWIKADMLDWDAGHEAPWDIVISNPPYISPNEKSDIPPNVRLFEPHEALFTTDMDGLEFYRAIAKYSLSLRPGAEIYLEIHEDSGSQVVELFADSVDFTTPVIYQDMQGKDRIVAVKRK